MSAVRWPVSRPRWLRTSGSLVRRPEETKAKENRPEEVPAVLPPRSPLKSRDPDSIALSLRSLALCGSLWLSLALAICRFLSAFSVRLCGAVGTLHVIWVFLFSLAPKIVYQYAVLKLCFLLLLLPIIVVPTLSVSSACRGYRRSSGCVDSQVSNWVHIYKTCPLVAILLSSQVLRSWENFRTRPVFSEPSS
jgi:hypothetical protein